AGRHFLRVRVDHLAPVITLDAGARPGHDVGELGQLAGLVRAELILGPGGGVDQSADRRCELPAHATLPAGVAAGLPRGADASLRVLRVGAHDDEAVAHNGDDAMRRVPGGGAGADDGDAAGPGERAPAAGADVALPLTVVDLTQRSQDEAASPLVHREARSHVL